MEKRESLLKEVSAKKPQPGRSKLVVSLARREILGIPLHRTELPPTLQGFFYSDSIHGVEEAVDEEDNLPSKNYGRFTRLPGTPASDDPSLSFVIKALPRNQHIFLVDSCNGLLLLGHMHDSCCWPEFVVCNPATQQWVAVPSCVNWVDMDDDSDSTQFASQTHISLLFDPAVSSHFQVLIFWSWHLVDGGREGTATVHAYSSETREWRNSESDWSPEERQEPWELWRRQISPDRFVLKGSPSAFVDGKLYLNLAWCKQIVQVDTEGKTRCIFPAPTVHEAATANKVIFVGQSQGRLHCIIEEGRGHLPPGQQINRRYRKKWRSHGLSFWVLGDVDTQEWVLTHKVTRQHLFGNWVKNYDALVNYRVVAMHPDCNMVFFLLWRRWNDCAMISYDLDHQQVRVIDTYKHHPSDRIIPFVPYLSELFLGVIGSHKINKH